MRRIITTVALVAIALFNVVPAALAQSNSVDVYVTETVLPVTRWVPGTTAKIVVEQWTPREDGVLLGYKYEVGDAEIVEVTAYNQESVPVVRVPLHRENSI